MLVSLSFLTGYAWLVIKCKQLNKGFMGLLFIKLSSVDFDPRSSSESREESVAASVELGCARTRYFNMLPSRLDGFGSDNFLPFFFPSRRTCFC